jgi:hypothetical protein
VELINNGGTWDVRVNADSVAGTGSNSTLQRCKRLMRLHSARASSWSADQGHVI